MRRKWRRLETVVHPSSLKPSAEDELLAVGQASMANPNSFSNEAGACSIREVVPAVTVEFRAVLTVEFHPSSFGGPPQLFLLSSVPRLLPGN